MRRVPLFVMLGLVVGLLAASPAGAATAGPELAQFDPEIGRWHMRNAVGAVHTFFYGVPGDVPLLGDWDCDGDDTVGMYRPANGFVYLRNSNDQGVADIEFFYGAAGDRPLAGDWNGDGCDTLAIYRSGRVFVRNELGTGVADYDFYFGVPGDRPFAGDFDGDGVTTVGLYRLSDGFAYLRDENSTAVADRQIRFGENHFQPVAGPLALAAPPSDHANALLWSDPATWGDRVPTSGQVVTIPAGKAVRLDVSPPACPRFFARRCSNELVDHRRPGCGS